MSNHRTVFTIGHSTHSMEAFLGLLQGPGVRLVADVRSVPYSRLQPQFNRETLAQALEERGLGYAFVGRELGGRPADKSCYENGRVRYDRLAQTEAFQAGIDWVCAQSEGTRITLMCAESEPLACHRALLVGRRLAAEGVPVVHIHAEGELEPHEEALSRLLKLLRMPEQELFRPPSEIIDEAYARQAARVAHVGLEDGQSTPGASP